MTDTNEEEFEKAKKLLIYIEDVLDKDIEDLTVEDRWNLCYYYERATGKYMNYDNTWFAQLMEGSNSRESIMEIIEESFGDLTVVIDYWKNIKDSSIK